MPIDLIDVFFEPFQYKSLRLRNRLAMAPMTRYFSPDGVVTSEVAEYYARRARGGVGLILTEALSPIVKSREIMETSHGSAETGAIRGGRS